MYQGQKIPLHNEEGFKGMRKAGRVAACTLDFITPYIKPGISTGEIDQLCHEFMISHGAIPATLGYKGYTKSSCTSVNHVVCHGIPSNEKILKEGDIINIDVTTIVDGWYGDTSRMFAVGKISILARRLIDVTHDAFLQAISIVKPGTTLGDIGYTIQKIAESNRFSVVRDFCGHGLGRVFHTAPEVLHFGSPGEGLVLQEGMFFTIEPMINAGHYGVKILSDGWTAVTRDKSLSAQFEHSIGVTATGYEIFTLSE
ncbi:methionine aminopeptidase [Candidatus Paracaedimonas acanthamoebae]|nr:methionine aminopeptidase [Candidatus Paracaedimonas acanthamoebae]